MHDRESRDVIHPDLTEHVDEGKRKVVTALLTGVAFAAPLMASFDKGSLKFTSTANAAKKEKEESKKEEKIIFS